MTGKFQELAIRLIEEKHFIPGEYVVCGNLMCPDCKARDLCPSLGNGFTRWIDNKAYENILKEMYPERYI